MLTWISGFLEIEVLSSFLFRCSDQVILLQRLTMDKKPSKKATVSGTKKVANGKKRSKKRGESSATGKTKYHTVDYYSALFFNLPIGLKVPIHYSGNYPGGYTRKALFKDGKNTYTFYHDKKK